MEKIAVSSEGPTLDDALDPRFGRAAGFIVVDPQTLEFQYVDNGASQARAQGAGIQAAEVIARIGVKALLTGYVGPKAFTALQSVGIKVGQNLKHVIREDDTAARLGGDEFVVILNEVEDCHHAEELVQRVLDAVTFQVESEQEALPILPIGKVDCR